MKKLISVLICITMLLSAVPMVSRAKAVTDPIFEDFENYTSGTTSSNGYVSLSLKENETAELEGGDGKSIRLYSPLDSNADGEKDKDNYINFQTTFTQNAVVGFSCLTNDSNAYFSVASKGLGNVWGDSAISGLFWLDGTSVNVGSNEVFTNPLGTWMDVSLAMDYTNHKVYVYINRELVETYSAKEAVVGTEYFNFNITRNRYTDAENAEEKFDSASVYFDNLFAYYPPEGVSASVSGDMVDSKSINEITVSFGQNVLVDDEAGAATLNGETVETEVIKEHGYITGLKLKNLTLSGSTEYQIGFKGIKNFLTEEIDATCNFSTASTDPVVSISCDGAESVYPADTKVTFKIASANLDGNPIVIYNNGEIADTILPDAGEFSVKLKGGTNNIYVEVPALDIKSETISIQAEAFAVIGEEKFFDFEGDKGVTGLFNASKAAGVLEVRNSDEEHGKSLYFEFDGATTDATVSGNKPFVIVENVTGRYGTYVYEAEFNFSQVETSGNFFALKTNNDKWNSMFNMSNGDIALAVGDKSTIYTGLEANKWIKLKATWDIASKTAAFYVDDVLVKKDIAMPNTDFDTIQYVNMSLNTKKDAKVSMYMDNIRTYFIGKTYNVNCDFDGAQSNEVPYENAVINLEFDQEMNPETLKTHTTKEVGENGSVVDVTRSIRLIDENGEEQAVEFETSDNLNFTATVELLKPNMNYTLDLSEALTAIGATGNNPLVSFKTKKLPFAIKDVAVSELGSKVNVRVDIQNNNSVEKSYIVIAGLYDGNMMVGSDAKAFSSANAETAELSITKPGGDYDVEIYVFDSAQSLNLIDKLIIK